MEVPSPWIALLLVAAAFRIWRLIADDAILDKPRRWLLRLPSSWNDGDPAPPGYRLELYLFFHCPWCLGFWISLVIWGLWQIEPHWTQVLAVPWALSAGVGLIRENLDAPEE